MCTSLRVLSCWTACPLGSWGQLTRDTLAVQNWACDDSVDEVVHWMEQVLGKEVAAPLAVRGDGRTSQREREVCAALQDGVLLCMLVQRIRPGLLVPALLQCKLQALIVSVLNSFEQWMYFCGSGGASNKAAFLSEGRRDGGVDL